METRTTYFEIKEYFLECCFVHCRRKVNSGWLENESEIVVAYGEFVAIDSYTYTAYKTNLENLMLESISLILEAGRFPVAEKYHRTMVSKILSKDNGDIAQQINKLPEEERLDFVSDLELLGIEISGVLPAN